MNHIIFFILICAYFSKYESNYYKNTTNILNKYPKIEIDYIFSKPDVQANPITDANTDNKEGAEKEKTNSNTNNPASNIFQNIFYDYYNSSVPLYEENMKCFFPMKKNLSLDIDNKYENIPKIKNISKLYGQLFIDSLKGKCEKIYIERWYYTLCPLVGAMQTLSYINPNEKKKEEEKQEVNYLGYGADDLKFGELKFLDELRGEFKRFAEKKYFNEIADLKEGNMYNFYGKTNSIIGVHKKIVKFYGENVFDSSLNPNVTKTFILKYAIKNRGGALGTFQSNIIKEISNKIILVEDDVNKNELLYFSELKGIKILKNEKNPVFSQNFSSFLNQSFFIYDNYLYSLAINLAVCVSMNCLVTVSNDKNIYKIDLIVDQKLALLDKSRNKTKESYTKDDYYCLFFGDDLVYFFGGGEIEELIETNDPATFILFGENLELEKSEKILVLLNETLYNKNYVFLNDMLSTKFISLVYEERINATHFKVKMPNKNDLDYFDKQITLDGKYIIAKNKTKEEEKEKEEKKPSPKYTILGNEKNLSLDTVGQEKPEIINIYNSHEEFNAYKIPNNKEFIFTFRINQYDSNLKDSYISFCLSQDEKCKPGEDYEMLIDLKNNGVLMRKMEKNDKNNNNSLVFAIIDFKNLNENDDRVKMQIIYINSTIFLNLIYREENSMADSEIKLKFLLKNESYKINYIILNQNKSKNVYAEIFDIESYVPFSLFKNIFVYEQKFFLDENAMFVDTFENGDYCGPRKGPRKVIIYYSCDKEGLYDFKIDNVYENKKDLCVYYFYAKSRHLCNPNVLMRNYLQHAGLKTYCYLDNNNNNK